MDDDPRPLRPAPPSRAVGPSSSCLAVALVCMLLFALLMAAMFLAVGVGLLALGPLVVAGVVAAIAFHYLVWGWWLSPMIHHQSSEENDQPTGPDEFWKRRE